MPADDRRTSRRVGPKLEPESVRTLTSFQTILQTTVDAAMASRAGSPNARGILKRSSVPDSNANSPDGSTVERPSKKQRVRPGQQAASLGSDTVRTRVAPTSDTDVCVTSLSSTAVLACTACKKRKIKCDRNIPCEACVSKSSFKRAHWQLAERVCRKLVDSNSRYS